MVSGSLIPAYRNTEMCSRSDHLSKPTSAVVYRDATVVLGTMPWGASRDTMVVPTQRGRR